MRGDRPLAVIDSSVAVKWVLHEPGRDQSLQLLDEYESAAITLIAPSLLLAEVGSVLSKRCRRKQLTIAQAREAFRLFEVRAPVLIDVREQISSALELSLVHHLAIYDCLYLALAIENGCDLVTADERFYTGIFRAYPFVRLLGEYEG